MKLEDIKVGDTLIPRRWTETEDPYGLAFLPDMMQFCDKPQTVEEVDEHDGSVSFAGCYIDGAPRWWPAEYVDPARSSPAQRLSRLHATVGRLLGKASGPERLCQLQRRVILAEEAAAGLEAQS